jgi:hypothetical protein
MVLPSVVVQVLVFVHDAFVGRERADDLLHALSVVKPYSDSELRAHEGGHPRGDEQHLAHRTLLVRRLEREDPSASFDLPQRLVTFR